MGRVLRAIAASPMMFPAYDDAHRFAMLSRFPHSVVLESTPDLIFVHAVAHSRRAEGYWRGRT